MSNRICLLLLALNSIVGSRCVGCPLHCCLHNSDPALHLLVVLLLCLYSVPVLFGHKSSQVRSWFESILVHDIAVSHIVLEYAPEIKIMNCGIVNYYQTYIPQ